MARYSRNHVPQYLHYKRTNKGAVKIAGKLIYLPGQYGSDESQQAYNRQIGEWFAAGRNTVATAVRHEDKSAAGLNVEQIIVAFMVHAKSYYRDQEGNPTAELANFIDALRTLRRLYGKSGAADFGPKCLKACQTDMVIQGFARNTINRRIGRIRQVFKWAVGEELLPAAVLEGLRAVDGLKRGRTEAKETEPVRPVSEQHAREAIAAAGRQIAAMIELQLLTGMRSGELVIMRTGDIDRAASVWIYAPTKHKTQHHGHSRIVYLGEKAKAILSPFLKLDPNAYIFSPADATDERRAAVAKSRKTPLSCGNRPGSNRKAEPRRTPGNSYTTGSYARAVARACDKAFPPPKVLPTSELAAWRCSHRFHPHQLRHTAATRFRREFNLETARALLGQKSMDAAEIYAEMDMEKARDVMAAIG